VCHSALARRSAFLLGILCLGPQLIAGESS
jgi:hypothetical protein